MTVYARGYRAYSGPTRLAPAAFAIAREGIRTAWSRKALKRIGVVYLAWFAMLAFFLYVSMGMDWFGFAKEVNQNIPSGFAPSLVLLNSILHWFYAFTAVLTALLAVLIGSPLIADDLKAGALPLYLVRPIRPMDYVLGKALVIPVILAVTLLLPGLLLFLLMGLWQPPGETWTFLKDNVDVVGRIAWHYGVSAAIYTGLTLFVSSRTQRRAIAAVIAGTILFAGVMLAGIVYGHRLDGVVATVLRHADLPGDTVTVFFPYSFAALIGRGMPNRPDETVVVVLAIAILCLGLFATWRRASSVEVTG